MTVGRIVAEPLVIHERTLSRAERRARVVATLSAVGLEEEFLDRYPRQLSGGQQQRVGIARATVTRPKLVVLDEPTSSLDVSVRAQTLAVLKDLRERLSVAYVLISHDINTVADFSHRVAVMYLGRVMETGPTATVINQPRHPYTRALLSATLSADPRQTREHFPLTGEIPSPTALPTGCFLAGRCPVEQLVCSTAPVPLTPVGPGHSGACVNPDGKPSPPEITRRRQAAAQLPEPA